MLRGVLRRCDTNDARVSMLRATIAVNSGDVSGAIALLRRSINRAGPSVRPYLVDLLVPLLLTRAEYDEATVVLEPFESVPPVLVSPLLALRAVLSASRGNSKVSRRLAAEAISRADEGEDEAVRARVLQRASMAAYWLEDFSEAENLSLEAARLYEGQLSFHHAAVAYSVLYSISHMWLRNAERARFYADRIRAAARAGEDLSWERYGLVAALEVAVESGDELHAREILSIFASAPLPQQYSERFSITIAGALVDGWDGRFEQAKSSLISMHGPAQVLPSRRALCGALLALFACAEGNLTQARQGARLAIARTAWPPPNESMPERWNRRLARIVAAATCCIIGDVTRGKRALSAVFDPGGVIAPVMSANGIDEEQVADLDRGYARLISVVARAVALRKPLCALTEAEVLVLRQLPHGITLAAIASELGKSAETVKKQTKAAYSKLGVRNRTQAINRAKELGIL